MARPLQRPCGYGVEHSRRCRVRCHCHFVTSEEIMAASTTLSVWQNVCQALAPEKKKTRIFQTHADLDTENLDMDNISIF
jgi:hypothetical protein